MLFRLGHDAVIGGDNEEGDVNGGHTRHHVPNEFFVSGDVYNGNGFIQVSKTQIDGHAPRFFFSETIRIRTGESLDQGRLSVVNMTGCTDDYLHVLFLC
jgi:hypothetical protein